MKVRKRPTVPSSLILPQLLSIHSFPRSFLSLPSDPRRGEGIREMREEELRHEGNDEEGSERPIHFPIPSFHSQFLVFVRMGK